MSDGTPPADAPEEVLNPETPAEEKDADKWLTLNETLNTLKAELAGLKARETPATDLSPLLSEIQALRTEQSEALKKLRERRSRNAGADRPAPEKDAPPTPPPAPRKEPEPLSPREKRRWT